MIIQPTYLGQPLYPGGFPIRPRDVHVNGKSVEQIYLGGISEGGKTNYSDDDQETLKSYIKYYVNAPVFSSEFTDELTSKDLMSMNLTDLIMECLEYGLDPL